MRSSFKRILTAALLTCALVSPTLILKAQDGQPATRPRRATATEWPTTSTSEPVTAPEIEPEIVHLTKEPVIRIGLVTGARSVTISTTGSVLNATDASEQPLPLELARVRIEPRAYPILNPPAPDEEVRVQTASTSSNKSTPTLTAAKSSAPASATKTKTEAESGGVRLTSRAGEAQRGEALYAPGSAKPLLDLRAPVVFAPEDSELHPVRYNEKPYRGRLEVFANTKGTLTVVNVIPLEDYVRGVVPNELSPGGWPELEALKAQAVAARTYAVSNLGRFSSEGYDLTPDTRSQVYGGRSTEHPLTDRAVLETRGRILTYKGAPVNALYTSTCGGRTEDGENIFGGSPVAYLRGRECALEAAHHFAGISVRTSREPASVKLAEHATSARDAALLAVHGFTLPSRLSDEWLASNVTPEEVRSLLSRAAALARQPAPQVGADATRPAGFATALALSLDGESRGAALLNSADVEYLLAFRDAEEVPSQNRSDVAAMLREGHLALYPDGTLRPRQVLTRARVLRSVAHALEARGLLRLQRASARVGTNGALAFRPASGKDLNVTMAADAQLFRAFGEALFAVREIQLVGGEVVVYHAGTSGEIDYLEVRPAESGAASDHVSKYAHWTETLTQSGVLSRLSRSIPEVGTLLDLRVRSRGVSGRVLDLEVVGTSGTAHVRGGRIRSALGLREQLFVIDRTFDESGRVSKFTFTGRGWGHGVGMCQVGAYGLARAGLSYEKILKHFYTGVALTKLY
ncbi:MAG: stage sporulation protein [Acidobacteriota bacterium]|jgi:stage II sporulation protein D|nr:stage sporulation protein [Acidobacteriota bacterium]